MNNSTRSLHRIFILLISFCLTYGAQAQSNAAAEKVAGAMQLIKVAYVDSVNSDKLAEEAIIAMLKSLDPHSSYISRDDLKAANEGLEGSFEGIGIQFQIFQDTILVISPIAGGPSEKLGIQAGDRIITIDGKNVANIKIKNEDVMKQLRGPKGTKVNVAILKVGSSKVVNYTINRDKIPLYSVDASYMINPTTGYIKVNRFSQTTTDEFNKALAKLRDAGMQSMILDLSGNGGGIMQAAIEMADNFLSESKLIVYSEGLSAPKQVFNATTRGMYESGKLVVMIDEGSASASEIVTGALQDWDRALVVGRRSFGKGLVQKPFRLSDGSEIRLTIQRYYTPVGRCIQKSYAAGTEDYYKDFENRYNHGEFMNADSIHFADSLKYFTPNKRVVYGGGGIMPDLFVPIDTTYKSEYLTNIYRSGALNQFTTNYVDKNRSKLKVAYLTVDDFVQTFSVNNAIMDEFRAFADKAKPEEDDAVQNEATKNTKDKVTAKKPAETPPKENKEEGFKRSRPIIENQIKARIASELFGNDAMYRVFNEMNPIYKKAVESMNDATFTKMKVNTH